MHLCSMMSFVLTIMSIIFHTRAPFIHLKAIFFIATESFFYFFVSNIFENNILKWLFKMEGSPPRTSIILVVEKLSDIAMLETKKSDA